MVEAWGPDRCSCLTEAMTALVETFARVDDACTSRPLPLAAGGPDVDVLASLLEEVIFVADVFGVVPVQFHLADAEDGGVAGDMQVVAAEDVRLCGPVPTSVSFHGLDIHADGGTWWCRAAVDVAPR